MGSSPELVGQREPCGSVGLERLGLAAAAVEGQHQLAKEPLPPRMRRRELLQLADERRVPSEPELGVDSLLLRREPQLVEPFGREPGEVLLADVYERRPAPEPERVTQQLDPPSEIRAPRRLEQRLEAIDVDVLASHVKPVARRLCDEHVPADQLAERRDGVLQ